jgi:hypothetical protein
MMSDTTKEGTRSAAPPRATPAAPSAAVDYDLPVPLAGLPHPGTGPYKDNQLLYAAGDVVVWVGVPNSANPPQGFEDPSTLGTPGDFVCCGWVDVSGYIFKLDETIKDIPAAGILTPVRSILTGGTKTTECTFLEALNPWVRSLYDDITIFPVANSPLNPGTTPPPGLSANEVSYILPDPPADNRYSMIFDSIDGLKRQRIYAPYTKVTARGNDQAQQGDIVMTQMTTTFYPGIIGTVTNAVLQRTIGYGKDMSAYFS